jgi:CubicO group peptidase (beta-lactamase class C family)
MLNDSDSKNTKIRKVILLITLCASMFNLVSCQSGSPDYIYTPPAALDDGLAVGTIEEVDIDDSILGKAVDRIRGGKYGEVHSVSIYKDGMLVFEEYFAGHRYDWASPGFHSDWVPWDSGKRHTVMSVGKSYTSAIVSIAIEEGYIESLQDAIWDYLPDYQRFATNGREEITIQHLVTMTSGLDWVEWGTSYGDDNNYVIKLWLDCNDQIACILDLPLVEKPGTHFNYSGGDMILLGEIVRNATGMDIDDFGAIHLFEPLGINPPEWNRFDSGVVDSSGSFYQTPREMMKFGITYLNGGIWEGKQIINKEWVANSSVPFDDNTDIKVPGIKSSGEGYGYTWYIHETRHHGEPLNLFYALGWGDQMIFVIPDLKTVVVFTGANYMTTPTAFTIFEKFILEAIE